MELLQAMLAIEREEKREKNTKKWSWNLFFLGWYRAAAFLTARKREPSCVIRLNALHSSFCRFSGFGQFSAPIIYSHVSPSRHLPGDDDRRRLERCHYSSSHSQSSPFSIKNEVNHPIVGIVLHGHQFSIGTTISAKVCPFFVIIKDDRIRS